MDLSGDGVPGTVVRLLQYADGTAGPLTGHFLVDYDPAGSHVVCAADPAAARRFCGDADAHAYVMRPSGRRRPDGRPDRPLTAYSLLFLHDGDPMLDRLADLAGWPVVDAEL